MSREKQKPRAGASGASEDEQAPAYARLLAFLDVALKRPEAADAFLAQLRLMLARRVPWRRGERTGDWFTRLVSNALQRCAHAPQPGPTSFPSDGHPAPAALLSQKEAEASRGWLLALLDELNPRYAEMIRRVDLGFEPKIHAAHQANLSRAQLDVTLHRARGALRLRILRLCEEVEGGGVSNRL